jgi:hypothetical protein
MNKFRCYRRASMFLDNWRLLKQQRQTITFAFNTVLNQIGTFPHSIRSILLGISHVWIQGFMNNKISVDDIIRRICRVPQTVAGVFVHRRRRRVARAVSLTIATSTMGRELGGEHRPIALLAP